MTAERLLDALDRVRKSGPDSWMACCPAHQDRSASLSIRETDDGKVLVHCFAGCSVHEVVSAVGLELDALFPPRQHHGKPMRRPFPAADAFRAVALESLVVSVAAKQLGRGEALSPSDLERVVLATERINSALSAAGVSRHA